MQGSRGDRRKGQTLDSGEGGAGMIGENTVEICTLPYVKQMAEQQSRCSGTTQRDGVGREVGRGSGWEAHVCCLAEAVTILWSNYPPVKIIKKLRTVKNRSALSLAKRKLLRNTDL